MNDGIDLKDIVKITCKKLGNGCDPHRAKIFNKNGILLLDEDIRLVAQGDILYCSLKGEEFNYSAVLDDYEMGKLLGVGGFGKVYQGKHRDTKAIVAIKFTDVGDQLSSANLIQAIYKEAESLKALNHKHIVKLYHAFIDGK